MAKQNNVAILILLGIGLLMLILNIEEVMTGIKKSGSTVGDKSPNNIKTDTEKSKMEIKRLKEIEQAKFLKLSEKLLEFYDKSFAVQSIHCPYLSPKSMITIRFTNKTYNLSHEFCLYCK